MAKNLHARLGTLNPERKLYFLQRHLDMKQLRKQRAWFWIAVAAIAIVVLALLIPHGQTTDAPAWMALLPAIFVGLLVPFTLLPLLPVLSLGHTPELPSLAPSFQRPPPVLS